MIESAGFRSETITRQRIAVYLAGAEFALLWKNTPTLGTMAARRQYSNRVGNGDTAVGVAPKYLRDAMNSPAAVMLLSRDGIGHLKSSQRYLTPKNLSLVQAILDGDAMYQQRSREWIGFAKDDSGQLWACGWKVTENRKEIRLSTIHRSNTKQLRSARRRYKRVKREE